MLTPRFFTKTVNRVKYHGTYCISITMPLVDRYIRFEVCQSRHRNSDTYFSWKISPRLRNLFGGYFYLIVCLAFASEAKKKEDFSAALLMSTPRAFTMIDR